MCRVWQVSLSTFNTNVFYTNDFYTNIFNTNFFNTNIFNTNILYKHFNTNIFNTNIFKKDKMPDDEALPKIDYLTSWDRFLQKKIHFGRKHFG
jgi:hypothetical protein